VTARLVVRGHGHPAVRASHTKTLELTPSAELGRGGTCVVAVGSLVDGGPLAGVLLGELSVGDRVVQFDAIGNPDWDPAGPAIVRRSDVRKPDTVATHASLAAADLPAELCEVLSDPDVEVRLALTRVAPQPARLIIATGEVAVAERAAADLITQTDPATITGRVLHLATPTQATLAAAPQPVEVIGYPPAAAVAAASPFGAGAVQLPLSKIDTARDRAVVVRVGADDVERTIRAAVRRGRRTGAVLGRLPWVTWGALSALTAPAGVRTVWLCLDPVPVADVDGRIAALRAAGMPVKQLARELAAELGLPAREIYRRATGSDSWSSTQSSGRR
jgi:hypothetical protein